MQWAGDGSVLIAAGAFLTSVWITNLFRHMRKPQPSPAPAPTPTPAPAASTAPTDAVELPVIDLAIFLDEHRNPELYTKACLKVAEALHLYGCLLVRDPRVDESENNAFLDLLERYFGISDGKRDARPQWSYQVGVTPENTERPRNHCARMQELRGANASISLCPPELDPKWRFFWRLGDIPPHTRFPSLNMDPVVPHEFPEWPQVMNNWGSKMLNALLVLAEMVAVGFEMPPDTFTSMMKYGPHLLAPTGSDLDTFGAQGTVLAGYHYDLNFLTIHGKSRFPGLYIWLRDGTKLLVRVPDGCLLVQAGKQLEYLTAGHVLAGFHEVVVARETVPVIERRRAAGLSLWRVSSTCFGHIASDQILVPLAHFASPDSVKRFPAKYAGEQVQDELNAINLGMGYTLNK